MKIEVSTEIKNACPQFAGIAIAAKVKNTPYCEALWQKIDEFTVRYREMYTTDSIKDMVTIRATREAYKKCGKDPSRYRPSGEALCRRILRGIPLYQTFYIIPSEEIISFLLGHMVVIGNGRTILDRRLRRKLHVVGNIVCAALMILEY